jgi:hypothetical protein
LGRAAFGPAGGQPFEKGAKHIQIKVQSTPSKNPFVPLFKSGLPEALIINSSYDLQALFWYQSHKLNIYINSK